VAAKKHIDTTKGDLERKLVQQNSHFNTAMDQLASKIWGTKTEVDIVVKGLDNKVEKINQQRKGDSRK
jgi:hypothetical protein